MIDRVVKVVEMEQLALSQVYGNSAYISAIATVLTIVTGVLFFTGNKLFGILNDYSSIIQVVFMMPLTLYFLRLLLGGYGVFSIIIFLIGMGGMLISAYGQLLLVLGRITFDRSRQYFHAGIAIGIWIMSVCIISIAEGIMPVTLGWIGMLAGTGYIMTVIGFLKGGQKDLLFYSGFLILGIFYPVWAIWLGSSLLL
jgi:hypothetical protein